jgi:hypothetical protein
MNTHPQCSKQGVAARRSALLRLETTVGPEHVLVVVGLLMKHVLMLRSQNERSIKAC